MAMNRSKLLTITCLLSITLFITYRINEKPVQQKNPEEKLPSLSNNGKKMQTDPTQNSNKPKQENILDENESSKINYSLAFYESDGFFTDVSNSDWILKKKRQKESRRCSRECPNDHPNRWYQKNFDPTFSCQHERKLGGLSDGAKWVCDPHRISRKSCLVYSIGSWNNFDFEKAVLRTISKSCEIHTFDPSVGKHPSRRPKSVKFHPWGIGPHTKTSRKNGWTMKSVSQIIKLLGHQKRTIDIFKMDCEFCEWASYKDWSKIPNIKQIQVELHWVRSAKDLFTRLRNQGFVIFHKEPNILKEPGHYVEYSLIRLNKKFFE